MLIYNGKGEGITVYADGSFGDCESIRKSTTGIVVKLFGDTVAWTSKWQNTIATSTCEAEYNALNTATCDAISLNKTVMRATGESLLQARVLGDNTAALKTASKLGTGKLKHLTEIKQHFVIECHLEGKIKLDWVSTKEQEADILTKALP